MDEMVFSDEVSSDEMSSDEDTLSDTEEYYKDRYSIVKPDFWFQHQVDDIFVSINHDFSTTVLVWCHKVTLRPDYLVSQFPRYGYVVDVQDRWTRRKNISEKYYWEGCTVKYTTLQGAREAATHLPGVSRNIKSMLMQTYINFIIMAEVEKSSQDGFCCKLQMERMILPKTDVSSFRKILNQFGEVLNVIFFSVNSAGYDRCVVTYRYVAQAYAAHFAMNGKRILNFRPVAMVIVTETEAQVLRNLKKLMQHYIHFNTLCD